MKRGYSTPSCQTFNSSFSIEELCALAVEYDSNVKFTKINDNQAYLYKEKSGKIIARTALHKVSETEYLNYVLENMYVKGIVFPTHLTSSFYDQDIVLNGKTYNWYAVSFITIDELIDWLNNIGIYTLEVNKQRDTIICGQKVGIVY